MENHSETEVEVVPEELGTELDAALQNDTDQPAEASKPGIDVIAASELDSAKQQHMAALAREAMLKRQLEEVAKQVIATGDQVQLLSRILGVAPSLQ